MRVILQYAVKEVVRGFNQFPTTADVAEASSPKSCPEAVVSDRPVAVDGRAINELSLATGLNETARGDERYAEFVAARISSPVFRIRHLEPEPAGLPVIARMWRRDRKSTRLNSSHLGISYAVFCLKKKKKKTKTK